MSEETTIVKSFRQKVDELEAKLVQSGLPPHECQWTHIFTPGLYTRQIYMPAGTLLTSEIHKTEHPFVISLGVVSVLTPAGEELLEAPYLGITKPGTQRVIYVHEDCIWTTFHVTEKTTVGEVGEEILEKHVNPKLNEHNIHSPKIKTK